MKKLHISLLVFSFLVTGLLYSSDSDSDYELTESDDTYTLDEIKDVLQENVDRRLMKGEVNRLEALERAVSHERSGVNKLTKYYIESLQHGASLFIAGEYAKAIAKRRPELIKRSPLDKEHTDRALELIGAFLLQVPVNIVKEHDIAKSMNCARKKWREANCEETLLGAEEEEEEENVVIPVNYKRAASNALKNTGASVVMVLGKFLLAKTAQKAGLTEDESKPWEKLPDTMKWIVHCGLHAWIRDQMDKCPRLNYN